MKNISNFFTRCIIALLISTFVCSCNNSKDGEICNTCAQKPNGKKAMKMAFPNDELSFTFNYYFGNNNQDTHFEFGDCALPSDEFSKLKSSISYLSKQELDPYVIVLYFDRLLSYEMNPKLSDLKGFSVYTHKKKRTYHKLFVNENGIFKEFKGFSAEVSSIHTNHLSTILHKVLTTAIEEEKSFLILGDKNYIGNFPNGKRDELGFLLKNLTLNQTGGFKDVPQPPTETCGPGCSTNPPNSYCVWEFGHTCKMPPLCPESIAIPIVQYATNVPDTLYKAFDTTLHYTFRDYFLYDYSLGQKYISYYYEISEFLGEDIPTGLLIQTAYNAYGVNEAISKLLDPSNNGTAIVLNSTLVDNLIDLVNDYKNLYTNATYHQYLDDVISDLNTFEGKTVNELIAYIESI